MREELESKLYQIDPVFFEQAIACRQGTMNEMSTCMAFGCECGDGWFKPIEKFAHKTAILNKLGKEHNIKFVCTQLKEKFGEFTCYTNHFAIDEQKPIDDSQEVDSLIDMFDEAKKQCEIDCYNVCEQCGKSGGYKNADLVTTSGWISRICRDCSQESMLNETKRFDERNNQEYVPRITLLKEGFYFLNMFYPCNFYFNQVSYSSIIQAYICNKDVQHQNIYSVIRRRMENSSFVNYMLFKQFGGKLLQEDYQLIKDITKARFSYYSNKKDLACLFRTRSYPIQNMGKNCDNIYGHCVCDECKNLEHKDLYAKILMEVREELFKQNELKQDVVCWKDDVYYLRNKQGQLEEKPRWQISNFQREHDIKDSDIKLLI